MQNKILKYVMKVEQLQEISIIIRQINLRIMLCYVLKAGIEYIFYSRIEYITEKNKVINVYIRFISTLKNNYLLWDNPKALQTSKHFLSDYRFWRKEG